MKSASRAMRPMAVLGVLDCVGGWRALMTARGWSTSLLRPVDRSCAVNARSMRRLGGPPSRALVRKNPYLVSRHRGYLNRGRPQCPLLDQEMKVTQIARPVRYQRIPVLKRSPTSGRFGLCGRLRPWPDSRLMTSATDERNPVDRDLPALQGRFLIPPACPCFKGQVAWPTGYPRRAKP